MTETIIDETESAILDVDVADEALERAAGVGQPAAWSVGFFCTGLSECPA
jgi:hypothetical protein